MRSPRNQKENNDDHNYKNERNYQQSRDSYVTDNEMLPRQYESLEY